MNIRRATVLDVPPLVWMWVAMCKEVNGKEPEPYHAAKYFSAMTCRLFNAELAERNMAALAINEETGLVIGCVVAQEADDAREKVFFGNLYVLPSNRGAGVAKALVKAVLEWGRSRGANVCEMMVKPDLVKFYERIGFQHELTQMSATIDVALGRVNSVGEGGECV